MFPNHSPWIQQLKRTRPVQPVKFSQAVDVAIIGGGIAGVMTAYFTLRDTKRTVFLLEGGKVAHGATGHNAGQIVSYFERQIFDIADEFGVKLAAEGQQQIDSAWLLLEQAYQEMGLQTPLYQFTGYAGCGDFAEVLVHLKNNAVCKQANINSEELRIAQESGILDKIPKEYDGLYSVVPQQDILSLLETTDPHYIAAVTARKGCMNSALFTEEVAGYLLTKYPDRFTLLEESPMEDVTLFHHHSILKIGTHKVRAHEVVLCTNGFERFTITNKVGPDIDTEFHHLVRGSVGYMAAYLEEHDKSPIAISYLPERSNTGNPVFDSDPYFYLTRRPLEDEKSGRHSLICIGGPEALMDDTNDYTVEHPYPQEAQRAIDHFVHNTYQYAPSLEIPYSHRWHGLMGYTPNGVRCVGREPLNGVLLYNLGCNGVGILPSIYGGKRIAQLLNGEQLPPSIFDPQLSLKEPNTEEQKTAVDGTTAGGTSGDST